MDHGQHDQHEDHRHGADCGHESVQHEGHTDYMHDGHQHSAHESHWDEHATSGAGSAEGTQRGR